MLFGAKREGVHVDRAGGNTLVVLVRLNELVVGSLAGGGPVVAVELEMGFVERSGVITNTGAIGLLNPNELLDGVVEVKLDLALGLFLTRELKLLNEVLVGDLGEAATLIGVEVDVVDVEGGGVERLGSAGNARGGAREFDNQLDLVVLERDEGKREAGVAAEPELKRNVKGARGAIVVGGVIGGDTVNHFAVTVPVASGLGELVPDVEPLAVVLVNALATDLAFDGGDELVTEGFGVSGVAVEGGEVYLDVDTVDKITVTGNCARNLLAEVSRSVELLIDSFHGKVGVPAVHHLPESNLRVAGQINVLRSVGHELHETASHGVCFLYSEKKIFKKKRF